MLQKLLNLLERYGPPIIAFAIVGFAADAGNMLYQRHVASTPAATDEVVRDTSSDVQNTAQNFGTQQEPISRAPASVPYPLQTM